MTYQRDQTGGELHLELPFATTVSGHAHLNPPSQMTSIQADANEAAFKSSSPDCESDNFSSDAAQKDEMEVLEDTIDEELEFEFNFGFDLGSDSPETIDEGLNATILLNGLHPYESEIMNQPCDCSCHHWNFEDELVGLQLEDELTILERWIAQNTSDVSKTSLHPACNIILPCQVCTCHDMMERGIDLDGGNADDEE